MTSLSSLMVAQETLKAPLQTRMPLMKGLSSSEFVVSLREVTSEPKLEIRGAREKTYVDCSFEGS